MAFVAISSKSFDGVVITKVSQSSGIFPTDKTSKVLILLISLPKYIFK